MNGFSSTTSQSNGGPFAAADQCGCTRTLCECRFWAEWLTKIRPQLTDKDKQALLRYLLSVLERTPDSLLRVIDILLASLPAAKGSPIQVVNGRSVTHIHCGNVTLSIWDDCEGIPACLIEVRQEAARGSDSFSNGQTGSKSASFHPE